MARFNCALCMAMMAVANAVTPIEKVIQLLEDMKSGVENEGVAEAKTYGEFACFCKDTTKEKSESVTTQNHKIDEETAEIADKTASLEEDKTELKKRKAEQEVLAKDLAESNALWEKELAEYTAEAADFSKAISSLTNAIKAMEDSKPSETALISIRQGLSETLKLADVMDMIAAPKHKQLVSFLQGKSGVDPENPSYQYHSNDIIEILKTTKTEFEANKKELDVEHEKAKKAAEAFQASLKKKMEANEDAIGALEKSISKLEEEIAGHREELLQAQSIVADDEQYLKDLTLRCEARANDWDQRSAMREDEITAISTALKVLKDTVEPAADAVNVRAMLLQKTHTMQGAAPEMSKATSSTERRQPISLLQNEAQSSNMRGASSLEDKKNRALAVLASEGRRMKSVALTTLAAQSAADPFKKVKVLIQRLIERLLAESKAEATKKGFCDTELGKARKERDFRYSDVKDLSADLASLEAKEEELTKEIEQLAKDIKLETKALHETQKERQEEKDENAETLKTAKEGLAAVTEALMVLRSFYKEAAKASFLQASPVDEDTAGAGFSGSYSGQQSGSKAVLDLLETIQSDFDRTIRTTEKAEHDAHRAFVEFSQTTKSSIASKTTKKELDEDDLETTKTKIEVKTEDLQTNMNLLDKALAEIEDLKPACIDTGMSYEERVKAREEEMAALHRALCILDGEGVEPECGGGLK